MVKGPKTPYPRKRAPRITGCFDVDIFAFWKSYDVDILGFQKCFNVGLIEFSKIWLLFAQTFRQYCNLSSVLKQFRVTIYKKKIEFFKFWIRYILKILRNPCRAFWNPVWGTPAQHKCLIQFDKDIGIKTPLTLTSFIRSSKFWGVDAFPRCHRGFIPVEWNFGDPFSHLLSRRHVDHVTCRFRQ